MRDTRLGRWVGRWMLVVGAGAVLTLGSAVIGSAAHAKTPMKNASAVVTADAAVFSTADVSWD